MHTNPNRIFLKLRATYWFIPSCMVAFAILLAFLMPWLDDHYSIDATGSFGWIGQTQTDGARAVLIAIAGSIIGVTGTTFSITIVAVSFASANFGPRLIANFMRDRGNQLTLGTFIATFVYSLLVLRRVHNAAGNAGSTSYEAFVPHLSVIVALLLALASVAVLIYFIHHIPETIHIDRLVSKIGRQLKLSVTELFPDADSSAGNDQSDDPQTWNERTANCTRITLSAQEAGFVQGIDLTELTKLADVQNLLVRVQYRPGDFVVEGDTLFEVWVPGAFKGDENSRGKLDDKQIAQMRNCFETDYQRTANQDCLFLADQLVEVIGRAMSPGINDPFTAITCYSWLKGALIEFAERDVITHAHCLSSVRVLPISFERMVSIVFDQTRQYICDDRNVALHAMTVLAEIGLRTTRADHRDTLRRRMDELRAASLSSLAAEVGGDDVARRHAEAVQLFDDPLAVESRREGPGWFGGSG